MTFGTNRVRVGLRTSFSSASCAEEGGMTKVVLYGVNLGGERVSLRVPKYLAMSCSAQLVVLTCPLSAISEAITMT